jgi:cytidylate kinase
MDGKEQRMPIITISRGSYSKGKEVAEKVCQKLGYSCLSRDILVEASEHFNIPEIKLVRALHDAPSVLERFTYGKERYLSYITAAFLERVQKGDVVYHGLAGHYFLKGVNHVLKVRILADLQDRVRLEMAREKISREEALHVIKKDDDERRRWGLKLFGMDTWDPSLYDMVLHIHRLTVDDAVDLICRTATLPHFQTTPESQMVLDDLVLTAQVRAKVVPAYPNVQVVAHEGMVHISAQSGISFADQVAEEVKALANDVPGVKQVQVDVSPAASLFSD